jgi:hypothetical protein
MMRLSTTVGVAATVLAIGLAAPAQAGPRSSGMAAAFPVGTCMAAFNGFHPTDYYIDNFDLINVAAVSCTDPTRDWRVTAQVQHQVQCPPDTQHTYVTRDVVVLCVVQDLGASG